MDEERLEDDRIIIEACLKKDLAAWSILIKKYSALINISIENRLKRYNIQAHKQDIEDIKQTLLSDIWQNNKLSSVTNRNDISYWVAVVAGNAAVEHFRTRAEHRARKTVSLCEKFEGLELGQIISSKANDPEDELSRAEFEAKVEEAIESLPAKEKILIRLYLLYDKKYREICDLTGLSGGTVSSYIKRAKAKLKKALEGY